MVTDNIAHAEAIIKEFDKSLQAAKDNIQEAIDILKTLRSDTNEHI